MDFDTPTRRLRSRTPVDYSNSGAGSRRSSVAPSVASTFAPSEASFASHERTPSISSSLSDVPTPKTTVRIEPHDPATQSNHEATRLFHNNRYVGFQISNHAFIFGGEAGRHPIETFCIALWAFISLPFRAFAHHWSTIARMLQVTLLLVGFGAFFVFSPNGALSSRRPVNQHEVANTAFEAFHAQVQELSSKVARLERVDTYSPEEFRFMLNVKSAEIEESAKQYGDDAKQYCDDATKGLKIKEQIDEVQRKYLDDAATLIRQQIEELQQKMTQDTTARQQDEALGQQQEALEQKIAALNAAVATLVSKTQYLEARTIKPDTVGMADYALESAGGRIILGLTSPTYAPPTETDWIHYFWGTPKARGQRPSTAIQPEVLPGNCWPMQGNHGRLAIALATPTVPTHITIEHAAKELWGGHTGLASAPRDFEAWAVYDHEGFAKMDLDSEEARRASVSWETQPHALMIASNTFEPMESSLRTFEIDHVAYRNLENMAFMHGQQVQTVVFRFRSNWGKEDWTCIYRVRVHSI
ncbi:hypothetical protein SpCBS45565_g06362 [Spizellomyces sp. 'palustris']|nr:hypothetical protein SpCBS45565_g06362 [Spizellomyces sp. 'palustris']